MAYTQAYLIWLLVALLLGSLASVVMHGDNNSIENTLFYTLPLLTATCIGISFAQSKNKAPHKFGFLGVIFGAVFSMLLLVVSVVWLSSNGV